MKNQRLPSLLKSLALPADQFNDELPFAKILKNGCRAFPEIIECIRKAQKSIYINMFIWRDDEIGNQIAKELFDAAKRGVKIYISKDSYGSVCEHSEECGISFFHKKQTLVEKIKAWALIVFYRLPMEKNKDRETDLYRALTTHPNVIIESQFFKADHSKFYIFDSTILIAGGINVENKENGKDMRGYSYEDYMIRIDSAKTVSLFISQRIATSQGKDFAYPQDLPICFGMNVKDNSGKYKKQNFHMEQMYLDLINSSQKELTFVMSYFSPLKNFQKAIISAADRGVKINVIVPGLANFQDDSNKRMVRHLLKTLGNRITLYFSPKMMHTKLVMNESMASFGSCNITKKAFYQLDELNVFVKASCPAFSEILAGVSETMAESEVIRDYRIPRYNPFVEFIESLFV